MPYNTVVMKETTNNTNDKGSKKMQSKTTYVITDHRMSSVYVRTAPVMSWTGKRSDALRITGRKAAVAAAQSVIKATAALGCTDLPCVYIQPAGGGGLIRVDGAA
jgi:hypothetical protein